MVIFRLFPWTMDALQELSAAGFTLFVVSNQTNYAKERSSLQDLIAICNHLVVKASSQGVQLVSSYNYVHHPSSTVAGFGVCNCRNPFSKNLRDAASAYGPDLRASWMLGDRSTDIECGQQIGVRTIQIALYHEGRLELAMPVFYAPNPIGTAAMIRRETASSGEAT